MSTETITDSQVPRKPKPHAVDHALAIIAAMEQEGERLTYKNLERRGVSAGTASKALAIHNGKLSASVATRSAMTDEQLLAGAEFSEKGKLTIAHAIALHQKRLDKAFHTAVSYEVQRSIARADNAVRKQNVELTTERNNLLRLLRSSAQFTPAEYKMILMCLHPDNSASPEVRARAFDLVRQKEARLTGGAR